MNVYLSDTEWEVRDSALELLSSCMSLAQNSMSPIIFISEYVFIWLFSEYPYFVDWFLRHNLLNSVIQALGDVEPYVQASALDVLSYLVRIEKVGGINIFDLAYEWILFY